MVVYEQPSSVPQKTVWVVFEAAFSLVTLEAFSQVMVFRQQLSLISWAVGQEVEV